MGEFSEAHQAHLGSAAAQKGSVGGRGWACRSGPPQSRLEVTVLALAGSRWWTGRPRDPVPSALRRARGLQGWVGLPWVPGRGGTCRVPDRTGNRAGIWGRRMGTMV